MERRDDSVISVAQLSKLLRGAVERVSAGQWVEAELGAISRAGSGHVYFTLKDEQEDAVLDGVMYRFHAQRAAKYLFAGSRVQVWGRATVWVPRGRMQFVVERLRPAGRGALFEALEQLKQKLQREGLFRVGAKRPLPASPKVIGVITSLHGAAWHDICKIACRRSAVRIILAPAVVQGEAAVTSILQALEAMSRVPDVEVVIVGRGGGSFEDLMAFNDERVVRAVAAFPRPVVSAVGHEVDVSLTDLAADVRAATPSEAAELVVADRVVQERRVEEAERRLKRAMLGRLTEDRHMLQRLTSRVTDPRFLIADKQQLLDHWGLRLERRARAFTQQRRHSLAAYDRRLTARHPSAVLAKARAHLGPLNHRLLVDMQRRIAGRHHQLSLLAARLRALSPLSVLSRGYAIALTQEGRAVRVASTTTPGQPLRLLLHQGSLLTRVDAIEED